MNGAPDEPEPEPTATPTTQPAQQQQASNSEPAFAAASAVRSVDENSAAGTSVGDPITATDDDNDTLTYALTGVDAGAFSFDTATGQITVKDALNYEAKHTYSVTVTVRDGKNTAGEVDASVDDSVTITVSVVNVNEPGTLTLNTDTAQAGIRITASVTDPDGTVGWLWRWHRSQDGTSWPAHINTDHLKDDTGGMAWFYYTPTADDVGHYLRVLVNYSDKQGGPANDRILQAKIGPVINNPLLNSPPRFAAASTTRSVNELTAPGTPVGNPVTASDSDGDTLTYALAGYDTWAFSFDKDTGQIKVKSGLDYGKTRTRFYVKVTVSDGKSIAGEADASVDDTIDVVINVSNVDEPGTVSFDPRSRFRVGGRLMANLTDPDDGNRQTRVAKPQDGIRNVTWKWESSADRTTWSVITGASQSAYTPVPSDLDNYLRVTASYDDGHGTGKTASAVSPEAVIASPGPPEFAVAAAVRRVDENSAAGTSVGDPITATDDDNDTLTYALTGADAGAFSFDTATGQIKVKDALNYEAKRTYSVTVTVTDNKADDDTADPAVDDTVAVTINVVNVDEPGTLTLNTQTVQVGTKITGTVTDPDGITGWLWRWHRSQDGTSWPAHINTDHLKDDTGGMAWFYYTPTADDVGYYLRVWVNYSDKQDEKADRILQVRIGPVTAP